MEFVAATSLTLRRTAFLVCGDWHRADDVLQDALCKLYLSWPRVRRARNPQAYARRTVVNAALDSRRRPWHREVPAPLLPAGLPTADLTDGLAERDEVWTALAVLGPRQRACVVLRYYEDLSLEQTAEILGCSVSTVKSQAARGLDTLRTAIRRARSADQTP